MRAEEQEARVARAARQDFSFTAGSAGQWICETEAGRVYLVREDGACDCPDARYRCTERGSRCKHSVALGHHLIALGHGLIASEKPAAAEWLANLDMTAVSEHLKQAAIEDAEDAAPRACRSCGTLEDAAHPLTEREGWLLCGHCADEGPEPAPEPVDDFESEFERIFG